MYFAEISKFPLQMDKKLLKAIYSAIDKAIADFKVDEESIFNNENERLKYQYEGIDVLKKWKQKQTCVVRNCNNKSIERSHTIQKSGSLKVIAENSHLLTPRFNTSKGEIEIIPIGINEASTFPGYCSEHERLFEEFENLRDIKTEDHLGLQLYRTVCREIVILENRLKAAKCLVNRYKIFRDKKIKEAIFDELGEEFIHNHKIEFKKFKFNYSDSKLRIVEKQVKNIERNLIGFLYKFHDSVFNDLRNEKFQKIEYLAVEFDEVIPIAIAGKGNFRIKINSKYKTIDVIFNVLPLEKKTLIFVSTLKKNAKELTAYMRQFTSPILVIDMIESWMIFGSDHWFIKPSVWYKIEKDYQSKILKAIFDDSFNIGQEFKFTIFNELKIESIQLMEQHYSELNEVLIDLLNKEKRKLTIAEINLHPIKITE